MGSPHASIFLQAGFAHTTHGLLYRPEKSSDWLQSRHPERLEEELDELLESSED
jgi:hypothetical protein